MFKVGDMAVYPSQGVGMIEAIETKEFSGCKQEFYVLRILDSDMTILVPLDNTEQLGVRKLVDKESIATVFGILQEDKEDGKIASWSQRQREYNEKIKTGDLLEVAQVLRELYHIKSDKDLSYGEKKFLELARKLLIKEIALAEGAKEEKIAAKVEQIFM